MLPIARILVAAAAVAACLSLAACGGDSNDPAPMPPVTETPKPTQPVIRCAP
jgi:hypothetical protein